MSGLWANNDQLVCCNWHVIVSGSCLAGEMVSNPVGRQREHPLTLEQMNFLYSQSCAYGGCQRDAKDQGLSKTGVYLGPGVSRI